MSGEDKEEATRRARIRASLDGKKKLRDKNIDSCQACGWKSPGFLGKTLLRLHHLVPRISLSSFAPIATPWLIALEMWTGVYHAA
jgi:hypothetical protein